MAKLSADDVFLRAAEVRRRYGGASDMWLWRRLNDPKSGFPQPVWFGRLRMWRLRDLENWETATASQNSPASPPRKRRAA